MWRLIALAGLMCYACRDENQATLQDISVAEKNLRSEQFGPVLAHADSWLTTAQRRNDSRLAWRIRFMKAEALLGRTNEPEKALELLTSRERIPDGPEWASERARLLLLRARSTYALGRSGELPAILDAAEKAASDANRPDIQAEVELRRGFLARDQGRFSEAQRIYTNVANTARQLSDPYLEARVENAEGVLLQSESRHDEAIPHLERARDLAHQAGASDTGARVEGNLGYSYFRIGDYDRALSSFATAIDAFTRTGNLNDVQIWTGDLGDVYYSTGNYAEATAAYKNALSIARRLESRRWIAFWATDLASVSIALHDWDAAQKYNDEALRLKRETKDSSHEASSIVNAGQIAAGRNDFRAAIEYFHEALKKGAEDPNVALDAHAGLADVYVRMGKLADAETEFRNTIAEIESRQSRLFKDEYRFSWLDSLIKFYEAYVDFLVDQNQPERALEAAESSRSKVLSGKAAKILSSADYRQLAKRTQSVLLEYWLSPKTSYLWTITPARVVIHRLPPGTQLLPLIRSYRAVTTSGRNPLDVADVTGQQLYDALLAPAVRDAGMTTRFIIVPDDELYSLNLETLPDGNARGHYWIEHATIRISPSLNYLASNASGETKRGPAKMLVIGDPDSSLPQFPKLEYANQEISSITSAMASAHPTVVEHAAATPASYAASKPGEFGFIHFSAHAEAAAKTASALDSAVILSGPPDRCRLAARDVVSIPLKAGLVTVSACRSAGGKTYGGEGLVGFAWAFMKAGAGNVIAGLWDVNDRSTVQLMSRLYSEIAAGAAPADALRTAKLELIRGGGSYAKPFYWAPFQIYTARAN